MKTFICWSIAIIITLAAAVYQRMTGPTHPFRGKVMVAEYEVKHRLPRSHSTSSPCPVEIKVPAESIEGTVSYRRYPSDDQWMELPMVLNENKLTANLPNQPPAGKLEYFITLKTNDQKAAIAAESPIVIRFKGDVPLFVLLPHVLFMFAAMLLSTLTALKVIAKTDDVKRYGLLTFGFLLIGGMILGPVVQKFAFGELWTGVPFGWDLTDNKTLIAFIAWLIAVLVNWKKDKPVMYIIAAVVLFLVYIIPHSMFGSELDYQSGEIKTGYLLQVMDWIC